MNIYQWLRTQMAWSQKTFGEGRRTEGICEHIEKELAEIRAKPGDVTEWIDVAILALDGAWRCEKYRHTHLPNQDPQPDFESAMVVCEALLEKSLRNYFKREWPEPTSENEPIEHVRA